MIKKNYMFVGPKNNLKMTLTKKKILGFILIILSISVVSCDFTKSNNAESKEEMDKALFPDVVAKINIEQKEVKSIDDIEPITGPEVKPIDYLNAISLAGLPVKEKKQYFINLILPAILIAKEEYKERLDWVNEVTGKATMDSIEKMKLDKMMKDYRAKSVEDLKVRLVTHPTSIVLAQASIESGWGTSRFFVEANNIFGVWSFNPNDPRIPTLSHRNGKKMYLYKYSTLSESVDGYFKLLATRRPFEAFRQARVKTQDPYKLVDYLVDYSERGEAYVEELKTQIRHNNFTKYDSYKLAKD